MGHDFRGWEKLRQLGEGGQGIVFLARSPKRAVAAAEQAGQVFQGLRSMADFKGYGAFAGPVSVPNVQQFAKHIVDLGGPDPIEELGALKVLQLPPDEPEREKALQRLDSEILAIKSIKHPAVLKLIYSDIGLEFIVTEYHPHGTLHEHLHELKGRALDALIAFRPLVEAVSLIHQSGAIHRDIKPKNIFMATDGHLVLGDFGIVLFKDSIGERMTETYDTQVGSRDWMAPWANTHRRLMFEEINPTLDIYPLGKVLWCMVSGRTTLDLWYYDKRAKGSRPSNNLEDLFPDDLAIPLINEILAECVVEEDDDCLKSAAELLSLVDQAIARLRSNGLRPSNGILWPCRVCCRGRYVPQAGPLEVDSPGLAKIQLGLYHCDNRDCGHVEFFWRHSGGLG